MRWGDAEAAWYADTIAATDYVDKVVPCLGAPCWDLLDIGAGSGVLAARMLGDGARWQAVEPQSLMRQRLRLAAAELADRGIRLELFDCTWNGLPRSVNAERLLAANLGDTHHNAVEFFDAMQSRWRRAMQWVLPAQSGPSTFCLAGFLPPELHRADMQPAYERTLAQLGSQRAPQRVAFVDWYFQARFADAEAACEHCIDRLAVSADGSRAQAVRAYVRSHGTAESRGFVIGCAKRSAVLSWFRV
jgi:hypothetical protein